MKIGRLLGIGLLAVLLIPSVIVAQQQATTNYQSIVIESFDSPEESPWIVQASKFVAEGYPQPGWVRTWPAALYRTEPEGETLRSLGVQAAFDRQGYNFLEFIPVEQNEEGETVPRGIPIPGQVSNIDMWVWGSNFDYYIDIHVRDFRGMTHVLNLGDIGYRGWRNLRIAIPTWIPQTARYVAELRNGEFTSDLRSLELTKIVLWTRPEERVNGFFVYLDEIKVETDMYRDPFDGEELRDPDSVRELWAGAEGGGL
ncbi:MAG: flagellar filament outer layer protein FlaA [Spirochaetales bacterium]|nr:flagellar filament outer layer protein FlaA [Spirochaetales bacterium]